MIAQDKDATLCLHFFNPESSFAYERIPVGIEWREATAHETPGQFPLSAGPPWRFLFCDPPNRWPIPPDARNVIDCGIIPDASFLQSEAINRAIRTVARDGGGTLHFPPGRYHTATIFMQSGVTLHLAEGARIQGTTNVAAYPVDPVGTLYTALPTSLIPGPRRRLIYWHGCQNAAIVGRGIIDGQGSEIRRLSCHTPQGRPLINLMKLVQCRNCRVEGVMLLDSEFWNTHVVLSENILFDCVKVVNERPPRGWARYLNPNYNWFWNNTDGINPDSSQDVIIRNSFFYTGDDCTAVKNTGTYQNQLKDVRNVHIHNNLMLGVTPMKIGTETRGGLIENVVWEHNRIVSCGRPLAIEMKDGATARNIAWRNITVDECNRILDFLILPRQDQPDQQLFSQVENLSVSNLHVLRDRKDNDNWHVSNIKGHSAFHRITNVCLSDIKLGDKPLLSPDDFDLDINDFVVNLQFQ